MIKRLPAKKVRILDLMNGKFFYGSKENMKPSYVITNFGQKISRVNIVATVVERFVSETGNYASVTLDDSTGTIRAKVFKDISLLQNVEIGSLLLVTGKVKEYNGERYINAEIVRKVEDANYESMRRLEILKELIERKNIVEEIKNLSENMSEEELNKYVMERYGMDEEILQVVLQGKIERDIDYKPKILEVIRTLDDGKGVEIGKIFEISSLPENLIEKAINELMQSGEIYEPQPGVLKRV